MYCVMHTSLAKGKTIQRRYHHFINIMQTFEDEQMRYRGPFLSCKQYCVYICSCFSVCSFESVQIHMCMWSCMHLLTDICEVQRTTMHVIFQGTSIFVFRKSIFLNCTAMQARLAVYRFQWINLSLHSWHEDWKQGLPQLVFVAVVDFYYILGCCGFLLYFGVLFLFCLDSGDPVEVLYLQSKCFIN